MSLLRVLFIVTNFENVMYKRLIYSLEIQKWLMEKQFGFQENHLIFDDHIIYWPNYIFMTEGSIVTLIMYNPQWNFWNIVCP